VIRLENRSLRDDLYDERVTKCNLLMTPVSITDKPLDHGFQVYGISESMRIFFMILRSNTTLQFRSHILSLEYHHG